MATSKSDRAPNKVRSAKVASSPKRPLRILVADDHPLAREGVRAVLEGQDFEVVAEASDGEEAIERALQLHPDVAVLDLAMPLKNGIEAAKEILAGAPRTKIMLLTVHREDCYVRQALQAGIQGYVLKSRSSADLAQAAHEVCQGRIYLSPDLSLEVVREYVGKADLPPNLGRLIFDSIHQPLPAGVRTAHPRTRRLLYAFGSLEVDLRIEPQAGSKDLALAGQILDSSRSDRRFDSVPVVLHGRTRVVAHTTTNEFGEFVLDCGLESILRLEIGISGTQWLSVALPNLRWTARRASGQDEARS